MSSLWHPLNDPEHFKNPEIFNPDRFIDSNGRFVNDEQVITFGVGKRSCLGQTLAEKEFFIFFTGIMQQFKIRLINSYPSTTPKLAKPESVAFLPQYPHNSLQSGDFENLFAKPKILDSIQTTLNVFSRHSRME